MLILGLGLDTPIETPDQTTIAHEIRASEQMADTFFQQEIKKIEENTDEFKKNYYENLIKKTRKEIFHILPYCKSCPFTNGIHDFLAQQGFGEIYGDSVLYNKTYVESSLFQLAFARYPELNESLVKIRNLFIKHNEYVELLSYIMASLLKDKKFRSAGIFKSPVKTTEVSKEKKPAHKQSEFDYLFNCSVTQSLGRQGF